jgi:hypothetical protein
VKFISNKIFLFHNKFSYFTNSKSLFPVYGTSQAKPCRPKAPLHFPHSLL